MRVMGSRELFISILREHGNNHVDYYLDFSLVCSRTFDEDVARLCTDLGVIPVDDWW